MKSLKNKMSGDQFLNCLQKLGFEHTDQRDGRSFDWMFEHKQLSPFLEWFCEHVHEVNLVNPTDYMELV